MTAVSRSEYPTISKDKYSHLLASQAGYNKAQDYCHNEYPHAALQMSIRAGYCFDQCSKLLNEGDFDAVVSLGSGFSLLTFAYTWRTHFHHARHRRYQKLDVAYP